jgi:hypothetical protein
MLCKQLQMLMQSTTVELLLARQWVALQAESLKLEDCKFKDADLTLRNMDMILWGRLVSRDTPWGSYEEPFSAEFEDANFDETLKSLCTKMEGAACQGDHSCKEKCCRGETE